MAWAGWDRSLDVTTADVVGDSRVNNPIQYLDAAGASEYLRAIDESEK
jgi:hypothetical protein